MPARRYEVRVAGRLSQRARDALADTEVSEVTAETVISGVVQRDEQLHDLLAMVQSLGLQVVSVQQVARWMSLDREQVQPGSCEFRNARLRPHEMSSVTRRLPTPLTFRNRL